MTRQSDNRLSPDPFDGVAGSSDEAPSEAQAFLGGMTAFSSVNITGFWQGSRLSRCADWGMVVAMFVVLGFVHVQQPFTKYIVREGETWMYSYPPRDADTVPSWVPAILALFVAPALVALLVWRCGAAHGQVAAEINIALLGLFIATSSTGLITDVLKNFIGRPRPCFMANCFPDGKPVYGDDGYPDCSQGIPEVVAESRRSFPSGHASWSMSCMAYLTLLLLAKLRVFSGAGHPSRMILALGPVVLAVYIGATRVVDYMHHPTDVLSGFALGLGLAWAAFRQHYPSPFAPNAHLPFIAMAELLPGLAAESAWAGIKSSPSF